MKIDTNTILIGAGLLVVGYFAYRYFEESTKPPIVSSYDDPNNTDDAYQGRITLSS